MQTSEFGVCFMGRKTIILGCSGSTADLLRSKVLLKTGGHVSNLSASIYIVYSVLLRLFCMFSRKTVRRILYILMGEESKPPN